MKANIESIVYNDDRSRTDRPLTQVMGSWEMWRHLLAVFSFATFCATGSHALLAQQDQQTGMAIQGLEAVTAGVRESRQPGQLVGGTGEGIGNLRGQTDAVGQAAQQAAGRFGGQGRFNNNAFNQLGNMYATGMYNSLFNQRQQLRMPISLGFTPTSRPSPIDIGSRVQKRLARIPQLRQNGPMTVEMDGRVAVLRGDVASQHERDLVGRLVLLEPGISDVRNELQVATP